MPSETAAPQLFAKGTTRSHGWTIFLAPKGLEKTAEDSELEKGFLRHESFLSLGASARWDQALQRVHSTPAAVW